MAKRRETWIPKYEAFRSDVQHDIDEALAARRNLELVVAQLRSVFEPLRAAITRRSAGGRRAIDVLVDAFAEEVDRRAALPIPDRRRRTPLRSS
jgi:hypothetical protein